MIFWKIQRRLGKLVESLSWGSGALDVIRHEVGVENLVTANKISHCDDYLIRWVFFASSEYCGLIKYFRRKVHGCVQIASLRSSGYGFLEDSKEAWEASRELVLGKWGRHLMF
ncbi:hypothetical protein Lser_V15G28845 [Lactuca serriola]